MIVPGPEEAASVAAPCPVVSAAAHTRAPADHGQLRRHQDGGDLHDEQLARAHVHHVRAAVHGLAKAHDVAEGLVQAGGLHQVRGQQEVQVVVSLAQPAHAADHGTPARAATAFRSSPRHLCADIARHRARPRATGLTRTRSRFTPRAAVPVAASRAGTAAEAAESTSSRASAGPATTAGTAASREGAAPCATTM